MQRIKYILVFLIAAYSAQSCSLKHYQYCELTIGKKCFIKAKTFEQENNGDQALFKRKFKNKGVQVFLPHISLISFTHFRVGKDFVLPSVQSTATFEVEYAQGKRGPPAFCS